MPLIIPIAATVAVFCCIWLVIDAMKDQARPIDARPKPAHVDPPVAVIPPPVPPEVTLNRYRRRITQLEADLDEAYEALAMVNDRHAADLNTVDVLTRELALRASVDPITEWIDAVGGSATADQVATGLGLDPVDVRQRLAGLVKRSVLRPPPSTGEHWATLIKAGASR